MTSLVSIINMEKNYIDAINEGVNEIDWSDLWIIDFPHLYKYEWKILMDVVSEWDKVEYLISVLHSRYGAEFTKLLKFGVFTNSIYGIESNVEVCDGGLEITYFDKYEDEEFREFMKIPWMKKEYGVPYPTASYINATSGLVFDSPFPTPIVTRMYKGY